MSNGFDKDHYRDNRYRGEEQQDNQRYSTDTHLPRVEIDVPNRTISPAQQAIENRKRHRKNDTTPPPELGQNLNA